MPGFLTDIVNNSILDLFFGQKPYSAPSTVWFGLSTLAANKAGQVIEPSISTGYGRIGMSNQPFVWIVISRTMRSNALTIPFPAPISSWGLIISGFMADMQYGGNVIAMFDFAVPKLVHPPQSGPVIPKGILVYGNTL